MFRTMIAGALLTFGVGVALSQTPPPADDASAQPADAQAAPADAQAAPADAQAAPDAQNGTTTPPDANAPADSAAAEDQAAKEEPAAEVDEEAAKKAKRKAECEAIKVGKPKDC